MNSLMKLSAIGLAAGMLGTPQLAMAKAAAPMLFIQGDMVAEAAGGAHCVLASRFSRGERIVWRVRVRDSSGKNLGTKDVKSVAIQLPNGKSFPMHFGGHPPHNSIDYFWSVSWKIPADFPTGTFAYKVVATALNGKAQTWMPFKVKPSELTIVK